MGNQETRGMHFVPETYLKRFGVTWKKENTKIFFFNIEEKNEIKENSTSNLCKKRDCYLMEGTTSEERQIIEDFYQKIEANYDHIYKILTSNTPINISKIEHEQIILFVITLLFRNQKLINVFNSFITESFSKAQSVADQFNGDFFIYNNKPIFYKENEIEQIVKETSKEINPQRVTVQLKAALDLFFIRKSNAIQIIKLTDPDHSYLTSDNPVTIYNEKIQIPAYFDFESELSLPIDDKHRLIIYPQCLIPEPYKTYKYTYSGNQARNDAIQNNYDQYNNADKFLLSKHIHTIEETLNLIKK